MVTRARPKSHTRKYKTGKKVRVNSGMKYSGIKPKLKKKKRFKIIDGVKFKIKPRRKQINHFILKR
tara:strand:+ start:578 stop:775 length:198 start_codon:yes stop_codon:yes gene_type:complete